MQIIAVSIPNSVFTTVKTHTTAKDMWDALKALYEGQTTMILVKLSQQLQSTRCGDEENIHKHFDKLANLREQLAVMGKSVADNEYALILMGLLPLMYASMLGSIAASAEMSRTAVSSAIVVKLAMDEYDRRTLQSGKAQDEAFTADSQKKRKGKKCDVECENCHKKGHTKAQCWAKGGGNEGGGPKRKGKDDDKKDGDKSAAATTKEQQPNIAAWTAIDEWRDIVESPLEGRLVRARSSPHSRIDRSHCQGWIHRSVPFTCDSCEYAKTTRKSIRKERTEALAQNFGEEIHTDVWGPSPTLSLGGRKYYVTFTDVCPRFTKLEVLRTKDEALKA